jgi:hypothetical protein
MKKLIVLTLILSGCQLTIQRLPSPVDPDVAGALKQLAQNVDVLAADYQKRKKAEVKK